MIQVWQLVCLLREYWPRIGRSVAVAIVLLLLTLPGPYVTKLLIDNVYPHEDATLLHFILLSTGVLAIFTGMISSVSSYFGQRVASMMSFEFQARFFCHLQTQDVGFFDRRETGEILSRFEDMQASLGNTISMVTTGVMNIMHLLIFPAVLLYIDWRLALLSLAALPFDTLLVHLTRRRVRRLTELSAETSAQLSARSFESIGQIRTVKSLGIEDMIASRMRAILLDLARNEVRTGAVSALSQFGSTLIKALSSLAYGWYGWTQVLAGNLSLGTYMAFSGYVGYLYGPIGSLIGLVPQFEATLVHARRFLELYRMQPSIRDCASSRRITRAAGRIEFRNVSFAYADELVLHGINLEIRPRTTVAVVGKSGSGKSTLAKLIPRFYDPTEGIVTLDGVDIRELSLNSLRENVGFAMQGGVLFQGTVMDNLILDRRVPYQAVAAAAKAAHVDEFVAHLPQGYDTVIGERGCDLSEGQKQRIGLARALLAEAPILILDEPTAALDGDSEAHVQQALRAVGRDRTVLVIAHRLPTIREADEIVVLEAGRIEERGSHGELVRGGGLYAKLWEHSTVGGGPPADR